MYSVGQVLYVILEKKRTILPVRVSEQIVRRTVEGESISYKVTIPGKRQNQSVSLSDLGSSHYASIDEVRAELLSNAERMIHVMIDQAKSITDECFPDALSITEKDDLATPAPPTNNLKSSDVVAVDLGDGVVGNINIANLDVGG